MEIKKVYTILYVDPSSPDFLGEALTEGCNEEDARETFFLAHDEAIEILDIIEESEDDADYEEDYEEDAMGNMFCDNSGYCSGTSCPQYWECHKK